MTPRALLIAVAAAIAALTLRTASVRAQPDRAARTEPDRAARTRAAAHVKQGQAFFQVGEYDHALAEYQAAHELSAEPSLIFNIALCHDRANRPEQALEAFRRYLALVPDGAVADEAREDIARLTPVVEKIKADRAAEDARVREEARLREEAARRPPPAPPPVPPPSRVPVYLMAAGAALAIGGGVTHFLASKARDGAAEATDPDTYFDRRDRLELERRIAIGAYAAGALMIAAGVVLRYTVMRPAESPRLSVTVGRDGATVAMEWTR
jgi:tetratricopeptide (TPR) repeat protein